VRLRHPRDADAHAIAAACSDPEVARWTRIPSPYTLEDARGWIALSQSESTRESALLLVIAHASDDRVAGTVGLEVHDEPARHGEIGYWVAAQARRGGAGTRAVRMIGDWGIAALELPYIEIVISPDNEPSRALARRAGFSQHERELREFKGVMQEFEIWRRSGG
jgi:RimJ/RimL family protein N-acetyltransferase